MRACAGCQPRAAPEMVLYDFACGLQPYCMNRDPEFFQDTVFQVDRLHSKNHSCGRSYHIKNNQYFKDLNSQANEQFNAKLKKVHRQLALVHEPGQLFLALAPVHLPSQHAAPRGDGHVVIMTTMVAGGILRALCIFCGLIEPVLVLDPLRRVNR